MNKKFVSLFALMGMAFGFCAALNVTKTNENIEEVKATYSPSTHYEVSDTPEELASYYISIGSGDTGTSLLSKLQSLNSSKRKKTMGYSSMGTSADSSPYVYTDYDPGSTLYSDSNGQVYGSKVASFYTKTPATGWNREHVWPDSKGGGSVDGDILMTRPTITSENSSRGNSFYVEGKNSNSGGWDPFTAGYDKEMRGEAARIILYCVVANSSLNLVAANTGGSNTMGNMETLIKWHFDYSPSTYELNRNNGAEYLQGNRNPFVDHPEYVAKIWSNFNSTITSICNNRASMYDEWVPGSCSTYGTNDAAGEASSGGESGGGESGGGESGGNVNVGELVTSNSSLTNGDKVVIKTQESSPKGVTGWDGSKDATVSTSQSDWKEFVVEDASSSGFKLKDVSAESYIASPGGNEFKYGTAGTCSVDTEGHIKCNNRYLCVNGSNYRFYSSIGGYTPFYVYLSSTESSGGGGEEPPEVNYTITYNSNGGSGSMSSTSGTAPTVASCTFTAPTNKEFSRWNTSSDGSGTDYTVGQSVTSDVILYAIWVDSYVPVQSGSYKYFKLSNVNEITDGTYVIAGKVESNYYAMSNAFGKKIDKYNVTVNNDSEISEDMSSCAIIIEKSGNNFAIKSGTSYLKYSKSTDFDTSTSSYSWSIAKSSSNRGTFRITSTATSTRGIIYRTGSTNKFGAYAVSNIGGSDSEYYDVELFKAYTAEDFANSFLTNVLCISSGDSEPTYTSGYSWSVLSNEFTSKLSSSEQLVLREADADVSGSTIEKAMARYDYIISKYGNTKYANFINRNIEYHGELRFNGLEENNNFYIYLIIGISSVSLIALSTLIVLKKRRR